MTNSSASPAQVISAATAATVAAGSARVTIMSTYTTGDSSTPVLGHGLVDFANQRSVIHLVMHGKTVEIRRIGPVTYQHTPDAPQGGGDRPWTKVDISGHVGAEIGQSLAGGGVFSPIDPASVGALTDAQALGEDTIGGVTATHYRKVIDLHQYGNVAGFNSAPLQKVLGVDGAHTYDLWLDAQGRVIQEQLTVPVPAHGVVEIPGEMHTTLQFSEFGIPVHVSAPPEDQTEDRTSMLASQQFE